MNKQYGPLTIQVETTYSYSITGGGGSNPSMNDFTGGQVTLNIPVTTVTVGLVGQTHTFSFTDPAVKDGDDLAYEHPHPTLRWSTAEHRCGANAILTSYNQIIGATDFSQALDGVLGVEFLQATRWRDSHPRSAGSGLRRIEPAGRYQPDRCSSGSHLA